MTVKNLGEEGFIWFIGIVEDREDPLKLGRVRVRIYNIHSFNVGILPTTDLPWATIMMPPTSASQKQVGVSPTGIVVGATVIGFFMDGLDCNQPVVIGTIHGIPGNNNVDHDVPEQARGINNLNKTLDSMEPSSAYNTKYPYNKVIKTERGHIIEIDDTPDNERIHVFHRSGTYTEVDKSGRKVDKVVGDHFEIIFQNQTVHIRGNQNIKIDGNVNITVDGTYTLESKGNMTFKAPKIDLNP